MTGAVVKHVVPLQLPRLAGTRASADHLVDSHRDEYQGALVRLFGEDLIDSSPSFTDQLVQRVVEGGAAEIVTYLVPAEFYEQLTTSARAAQFPSFRAATEAEIAAL